jgi:tetratricopeptide (TPR) repeat protein
MNARRSLELAAVDDTVPKDSDASPKDNAPKSVVIPQPNPYPGIAFFLGCYYDQTGKPLDGLRVLTAGLDLPGTSSDAHVMDLLIERGAALVALKRWGEALASYQDALKLEGVAPGLRAYAYRGKGLALAGMGRTAESRAAYEEALKLTANDPDAQRDLEMIERLRDGGPRQPSQSGKAH